MDTPEQKQPTRIKAPPSNGAPQMPPIPKELMEKIMEKHSSERARKEVFGLAERAISGFANFLSKEMSPETIGQMAAEAALAAHQTIEDAFRVPPAKAKERE